MGEKIYGHHAIEEALKKAGMGSTLFVERGRSEKLDNLIREARLTGKVAVKKVSRDELSRMLPGADLRGALLDMGGPRRGASRLQEVGVEEFCSSLPEEAGALVLILDGITDPHNLGAILRSAECAGAHGVIIPKRRSVGLTATVAKASAGAVEYMPVARVTNINAAIADLKEKGVWIFGAAAEGSIPMYQADLTIPAAIVIGNEGSGMSPLVRKNCDVTVHIPMKGNISSLNASCAASVLLYEALRQRLQK